MLVDASNFLSATQDERVEVLGKLATDPERVRSLVKELNDDVGAADRIAQELLALSDDAPLWELERVASAAGFDVPDRGKNFDAVVAAMSVVLDFANERPLIFRFGTEVSGRDVDDDSWGVVERPASTVSIRLILLAAYVMGLDAVGNTDDWSLDSVSLRLRPGALSQQSLGDFGAALEPLWAVAERLYEEAQLSPEAMEDFAAVRRSYQQEMRRVAPNMLVLGALAAEVARWVSEAEDSPATDFERGLLNKLDEVVAGDSRSVEAGREIAIEVASNLVENGSLEELAELGIPVGDDEGITVQTRVDEWLGLLVGWRDHVGSTANDLVDRYETVVKESTSATLRSGNLGGFGAGLVAALVSRDAEVVTVASALGAGVGVVLRTIIGVLRMYLVPRRGAE